MKIKKIINIIHFLVMVIVIVVAFLSAMSVFSLPHGLSSFVVQSGSMEPAIKTGSIVFVKPQSEYQIDDIATFKVGDDADIKNPSAIITHRIVDTKNEDGQISYITKGDANQTVDMNPRPKNMLIGRVIASIPLIGIPVAFAKTQTGFIALIVIPSTIIIYNELLTIKKEINKIIKKKKIPKNKTKLKPKLTTLLIFLCFSNLINCSLPTNAYFSDQGTITSNSVSTGFWSQDLIIDPSSVSSVLSSSDLLPTPTSFGRFVYEKPQIDPIIIDAIFNYRTHYLDLTFSNIPVNFGGDYQDKLEYEVTYNSSSIQKGLFGQITPDQISLPFNQVKSRHFLGVCSTYGQVCMPDPIDNGSITIKLTGLVSGTPISINHIIKL